MRRSRDVPGLISLRQGPPGRVGAGDLRRAGRLCRRPVRAGRGHPAHRRALSRERRVSRRPDRRASQARLGQHRDGHAAPAGRPGEGDRRDLAGALRLPAGQPDRWWSWACRAPASSAGSASTGRRGCRGRSPRSSTAPSPRSAPRRRCRRASAPSASRPRPWTWRRCRPCCATRRAVGRGRRRRSAAEAMRSSAMNDGFTMLSTSGILGYGFAEESLRRGMEREPQVIGCDGGSTDPGPYYLGAGQVLLLAPLGQARPAADAAGGGRGAHPLHHRHGGRRRRRAAPAGHRGAGARDRARGAAQLPHGADPCRAGQGDARPARRRGAHQAAGEAAAARCGDDRPRRRASSA